MEFIRKIFSGNLAIKGKIFASISLSWVVLVGYLIWWNGIKNIGHDKSFQWNEWIWFGVVPAIHLTCFILYGKKMNKVAQCFF